MSRVYFHTPFRTAELHGAERAWAGQVVTSLSEGLVRANATRIEPLLPPGHFTRQPSPLGLMGQEATFMLAWRTGVDLHWRGHRLPSWHFALNTAILVGNDPIRFLARLDAQCEIHAWVDGPDRRWLADIIHAGLDGGVYRGGMGWDSIIDLLVERDDEPVVMSYSVTDDFPNPYCSTRVFDTDEARDAWWDLPTETQWAEGMQWLRAQQSGLQIAPDNLAAQAFGHRLTVFDLLAEDRDTVFTALVETGKDTR